MKKFSKKLLAYVWIGITAMALSGCGGENGGTDERNTKSVNRVNLQCTECNYEWEYGYWEWIWKAPVHWFKFLEWKDYRKTKCPNCEEIIWIAPIH